MSLALVLLGKFIILILLFAVVWIWTIVNVVSGRFEDRIDKVVWLILVLFMAPVGILLYFFIGRGQKIERVVPIKGVFPVRDSKIVVDQKRTP